MGDPLRKVVAGEPVAFSAATWNALTEGARAAQTRRHDVAPGPAASQASGNWLRVRNDSGDDLARFSILGITGIVYSAADNEAEFFNAPTLTGDTPGTSHVGKFVVLQQPLRAGGIGWAAVAGLTVCRLHVYDTAHKFAEVSPSNADKLLSVAGGSARIIYQDAGTGEVQALVRLADGGGIAIGKTDAAHAKNSDGVVSVWAGVPGSESDTGYNVEAYNLFGDVASGKWVAVALIHGYWYLIATECP